MPSPPKTHVIPRWRTGERENGRTGERENGRNISEGDIAYTRSTVNGRSENMSAIFRNRRKLRFFIDWQVGFIPITHASCCAQAMLLVLGVAPWLLTSYLLA